MKRATVLLAALLRHSLPQMRRLLCLPPAVPLGNGYRSVLQLVVHGRHADLQDQTWHWTGTVQSLYSAVRVDGKVFRVMGREVAESQADFTALVEPVYRFLNESSSRVPMTDWVPGFTTEKQRGFKARSVVGGVFIKMLAKSDDWKKWSTAAGTAGRKQ